MNLRSVVIGDRNQSFPANEVSSSKYTWYSLIPKALIEQFRRIANVYFLIISILQLSTDLTSTSRFTTVIPLGCILLAMSYGKLSNTLNVANLTEKQTHHLLWY
eukprot:1139706_1